MTATITTQYDADSHLLTCRGEWDLASLPQLTAMLDDIAWPKQGSMTIDGSGIVKMDTSGAWLLNSWIDEFRKQGLSVDIRGFSDQYSKLLTIVDDRQRQITPLPEVKRPDRLAKIGISTAAGLATFYEYLTFVGLLSIEALRIIKSPRHLRFGAFASTIFRTGYTALPIIAMLSFMIGVVITYQMGLQLKNYGANVYIVDLLGLAILREFGPLLTAIMVAGRSGSAFTAELGMMKLNQEIDALDTIGVTPSELLLLPRIAGLVIALPLLTVWADIIGVIGGMVVSNNMLHITWYDFMHRFPNVIPVRALLIGLGKAPVFALIIASIGCFQGVKVSGSAESVGTNTTRSVVLAIFFIIVADAIFSVIFSKLKL